MLKKTSVAVPFTVTQCVIASSGINNSGLGLLAVKSNLINFAIFVSVSVKLVLVFGVLSFITDLYCFYILLLLCLDIQEPPIFIGDLTWFP